MEEIENEKRKMKKEELRTLTLNTEHFLPSLI